MLADVQVRQNLPQLLAGFDVSDVPDVAVSDVVLDSRQVTPGALFAACAGTRAHGVMHAHAAAEAGAAAMLWEPATGIDPGDDLPAVAVPNLSQHVGAIAARLYGDPSRQLFVAGVTGTDGKTSCAWLIARALTALGSRCGYLGTLGFGAIDDLAAATHTTPDAARLQRWLARLAAAEHEAVAMEVSSHALAQQRTDAVAFDVAVLTQIGRDHLDYHGDETAYIAAKRRLFDSPDLRVAVLNADDATGHDWLTRESRGVSYIAYGESPAVSDYSRFVRISRVDARADGLVVDFATHLGSATLASRLVGTFNAWNLAATLAVLLARDVSLVEAVEALAAVPTVPGRMERVDVSGDQPLVIVDYAHTPGALEAALSALSAHVEGRLLCVFGCGGNRDRGKRPLMGAVAARHADRFWITDDNPRSEDPAAIVADVLDGIPEAVTAAARYEIVHSRADAIAAAIADGAPGDVVLIAGKGHETTQQYGTEMVSFDDRVAARHVLEAL
ncbi:UDP-N-acetylmuramoyl-L-alanyl-D-glutamate--2,6-diaminopimelate ligase [Salinisphaera hydrothermalis]|uniref:UDP-N-acetylmuramoyl-L-alanyl-D-glutamate--2,6-diaminopimelate ligase n=1 Tax=Salinisphaera hydrothermalis (strain C41B8) TaxID=1304275 RepID=A0A084IP74_SALHC|nr:UDP-N-acetylmuramoyl-L-alanyl-D-glutamate--2,6-diaminopimelate ligase [Salinisphaera hydrothermalis]KEZ78508.1 UDP-N-acetylmuramoylalanyl-D-glutamate--2,6-diaminopimelate ligase [Salinisphaera hydrothermalis C41B8]